MTAAERQARRREKLRETARRRLLEWKQARGIGTYQPPVGYARAKGKLLAQGRHFERARRDWGFEEGVFIDGALMGTLEVIKLAELSPPEQQRVLAEHQRDTKADACSAVQAYMKELWVSLDELTRYLSKG